MNQKNQSINLEINTVNERKQLAIALIPIPFLLLLSFAFINTLWSFLILLVVLFILIYLSYIFSREKCIIEIDREKIIINNNQIFYFRNVKGINIEATPAYLKLNIKMSWDTVFTILSSNFGKDKVMFLHFYDTLSKIDITNTPIEENELSKSKLLSNYQHNNLKQLKYDDININTNDASKAIELVCIFIFAIIDFIILYRLFFYGEDIPASIFTIMNIFLLILILKRMNNSK